MERTAILYITEKGHRLAERVEQHLPGAQIVRFGPGIVADLWAEYKAFVFIMASGIAVRAIAPLLKDKRTDPAVVVLDESGKFSVSLSGGHLGGANALAKDIAGFLGGEAIITTASDVNGLPSLDLWARDHDLIIEDWGLLPELGTRFVNNGALRVYAEVSLEMPEEFLRVADPRYADIIISNRRDVYAAGSAGEASGDACITGACRVKGQLYLRPRNLVVGIGCNSGTSQDEIGSFVRQVLEEHNLSILSVAEIATIDIKTKEPGLQAYGEKHNFSLQAFSSDELNRVAGIEKSDTVFKATGAYGVAEPAAILASGITRLLVPKQKKGNVTVAVTEKKSGVRSQESGERGRISIVGTGPGSLEHITPAALNAIKNADVIVGYGTYLDLIRELLQGKEVVSTGMTQEIDRCAKAIQLALSGRTVAVISGGDPGVYAMAGLVFELLRQGAGDRGQGLEKNEKLTPDPGPRTRSLAVEVIPGISALNAAASRLGAPLMHDFACISLSDRLTPWGVIERRLESAAEADFVIVLYNPRSRGRAGHLNRARDIILKHREPTTIVGIVKGAMRENENIIVTDLEHMQDRDVDMQTTVIVGNSKTFMWNELMITPRGYEVNAGSEG